MSMNTPIAYIEPPTIPDGMTIAEYRRSRRAQRKRLVARVLSPFRATARPGRPVAA
jgi:hypothetical protein